MTLAERIDADLKTAMKAGEAAKVSTLRMLKAELVNAAIAQRQPQVADPQALEVLRRQIKQHRESLEAFQQGRRADLVEKESKELAILEGYLPPQMSEEALRAIVAECIQASGAAGPKEMGRVMKLVMERVKGQADGKVVNRLVAQALSRGGA